MNKRISNILVKIFSLLIALALLVVSHYALVFFVVGSLPTLVAVIIDKKKNKPASNIVGAFNFMGIIPYLLPLWRSGNPNFLVQNLMNNPFVWFIVYGAASIGWIVVWLVPELFGILQQAKAERKKKKLQEMQKELVEEWGEEVKYNKVRS